ncbi:hypothetical protein Taro_017984 [Colocasia esculenta]|uniref:POT1A/B-like OB fold domain-containing protein n=1 Tax=Colocasia esculenta TaxID=4460 RepID=A0A843UUY4_COLES|nr:hypothetical protein [Colocasia esculenta]
MLSDAITKHSLDTESGYPSPLYFEASPLGMDTLHTFPPLGSILRMTAKKCLNEVQRLLDGHQWVKLRMVTCGVQSGIWNIMFKSSSKIRLLSDEDEAVLLHKRNYNERMTSELHRRPLFYFRYPSCITEIDCRTVIDATLMDSLTSPEVMHRCKCIVRVVAAFPWRAKDLYSSVHGQYRLRLTLEDPTARVHAYISGEDGVKFFGRFSTHGELTRKMNKLLGIAEAADSAEGDRSPRNPPWVKCCLMSHYVEKGDPWQSRRYQIFGTKLVG